MTATVSSEHWKFLIIQNLNYRVRPKAVMRVEVSCLNTPLFGFYKTRQEGDEDQYGTEKGPKTKCRDNF